MSYIANRKLGRLPAQHDARTLRLARYLTPALPPPPTKEDWTGGIIDFGMAGNDKYGDCVVAGAIHAVMAACKCVAGNVPVFSDQAIIDLYLQLTGGADNGLNEQDFLNWWRKNSLFGNTISGYVAVDPRNLVELRQGVYIFGSVKFGWSLPRGWYEHPDPNTPWGICNARNGDIVGGHDMPALAYDEQGITVVTWGARQKILWEAVPRYADEAYVFLLEDWKAKSPGGFDAKTLQDDLGLI